IEFGERAAGRAAPYVLVVSRLLPYKRVEVVAGACRQLGLQLVVVGEGPAARAVAAAGGEHVELLGTVTDAELNGLLHGCLALVQAGAEDFGLTPLEANAAGRPAVAYAAGGALETVIDGKTGLLVYEDSVGAFADAIARAARIDWCDETIR